MIPSQVLQQSSVEDRFELKWLGASIVVLMLITIAVPADHMVRMHGTRAILPPSVIATAKIVSRFVVVVTLGWQLVFSHRRAELSRTVWPLIPFVCFGLFGMVSMFWSARAGTSLKQAISFLTLMILSAAVAVHTGDRRQISNILRRISVCLIVIAAALLVLRFAAPQYGALTKNSSGLFHSTSAGASSSIAILILVACRLIWNWSWTRSWLLPGVAVHLATLLVGGNRYSFILAIILSAVAIAALLPRLELAALLLVFGVACTVWLAADPSQFATRDAIDAVFDFGRQGQSTASLKSISGRSEMWDAIWSSYLESIWVGHGYFVTSARGELYVWYEYGNWTAHNFMLQVLATTGVVGAVLILWGFLSLFVRVLDTRGNRKLRHFLLLIGLWFFLWGLLNASFLGPMQTESVVFAVASGLACSRALISRQPALAEAGGRL